MYVSTAKNGDSAEIRVLSSVISGLIRRLIRSILKDGLTNFLCWPFANLFVAVHNWENTVSQDSPSSVEVSIFWVFACCGKCLLK